MPKRSTAKTLWLLTIAAMTGAATLVACSTTLPDDWRSLHWQDTHTQAPPDTLQFQFLGAGGIYLRYADQALMGDPFFSNPPLSHWLTLRDLAVKTDVIDQHLPPLDAVRGILVGHGHHDHAMDIPYIASRLDDAVKIYGSDTVANLMAAELPAHRREALNSRMAQAREGGEWVYLTPHLRILPIYSEHSPHVGNTVFAADPLRSPLTERARSVLNWKAGENLNYVIDFLEPTRSDATVAFRVFYQSSASHGRVGQPPDWLLQDGVAFDLALLCAANYDAVDDYPETILRHLKPRQIALIHWEIFWDAYSTAHSKPLPGLDFAALEARMRAVVGTDTPIHVPQRGATLALSTTAPR